MISTENTHGTGIEIARIIKRPGIVYGIVSITGDSGNWVRLHKGDTLSVLRNEEYANERVSVLIKTNRYGFVRYYLGF